LQEHFGRLVLKCGDGAYEILELQEEGKKSISAGEYLNGMKGRGVSLPMSLKGSLT
jgi:methionyl-tRNA formyltransferase